jgi:voltage-dependent calcium channel P/Q type alpha-1A
MELPEADRSVSFNVERSVSFNAATEDRSVSFVIAQLEAPRSPTVGPLLPAADTATCYQWCRTPYDVSLEHSSFFVFDGYNPLRRLLLSISKSRPFSAVVLLLITCSTVLLALEDPRSSEVPLYRAVMENVFLAAFALEMILKMVAYGVVLHEGAYFRDPWNCLDFVIVALLFANLSLSVTNVTVFRALRVLRPLRSTSAFRGLRVLVGSLFYSIAGLFNVALLAIFVYAVFAVLGVQLWEGKFRQQCRDDFSGRSGHSLLANRWCLVGDRCWLPHELHLRRCREPPLRVHEFR